MTMKTSPIDALGARADTLERALEWLSECGPRGALPPGRGRRLRGRSGDICDARLPETEVPAAPATKLLEI